MGNSEEFDERDVEKLFQRQSDGQLFTRDGRMTDSPVNCCGSYRWPRQLAFEINKQVFPDVKPPWIHQIHQTHQWQ